MHVRQIQLLVLWRWPALEEVLLHLVPHATFIRWLCRWQEGLGRRGWAGGLGQEGLALRQLAHQTDEFNVLLPCYVGCRRGSNCRAVEKSTCHHHSSFEVSTRVPTTVPATATTEPFRLPCDCVRPL